MSEPHDSYDDGLRAGIAKELNRYNGAAAEGLMENRLSHRIDGMESFVRAWLAERVPSAAEIEAARNSLSESGVLTGWIDDFDETLPAVEAALLAARSVTQPPKGE